MLPAELIPLSLPTDAAGVAVWSADLRLGAFRQADASCWLDLPEWERASRFRFERDQWRYICCRGLLRELLASRTGRPPETLRFRVGPHGKPSLTDGGRLRFNVSHSGDRALFALCEDGREVGVDLESAERIGDARDLPGLAARALTPADRARWQALPEGERAGAFLRAWTRIEAHGKATGQGLGTVLGTVGVTFAPDEPAQPPGGATSAAGWKLFDLPVGEGWAGALVVVGSPP